jgi:hypothetical protein
MMGSEMTTLIMAIKFTPAKIREIFFDLPITREIQIAKDMTARSSG